jgi:hypothetical protein
MSRLQAVIRPSSLANWLKDFAIDWRSAWNHFWFSPTGPETLAVIRIGTGAMMAYIHVIWISVLTNFMGTNAWVNSQTVKDLHLEDWGWSWLFYVQDIRLLFLHQVIAIVASLCMCLGLASRLMIPLAWWMTLMVCHRMTGALFGLDQIVMMLTMYLMLSSCGACWSLDAGLWQAERWRWLKPRSGPTVMNNISTRLIQLHLCVIYLFGGLSKMRGEMWWDGSAMWFSLVNYEYQSLNLTWLGHFPILIGLLTAITIFWESFYCALIWPRLTRPITLGLALLVHGGIAIALGMWTFGTMMIVANFIFIPPHLISNHRLISNHNS